jgi:hypothetical protein
MSLRLGTDESELGQHNHQGNFRGECATDYKFRSVRQARGVGHAADETGAATTRLIEPVIGQLNAEHRIGRNYFGHRHATNAVPAAAIVTSIYQLNVWSSCHFGVMATAFAGVIHDHRALLTIATAVNTIKKGSSYLRPRLSGRPEANKHWMRPKGFRVSFMQPDLITRHGFGLIEKRLSAPKGARL